MRNALPSSIRSFINDVENTVAKWPIKVSMDQVTKWMLQFEPDDYFIAARLINNLDVLGTHDIRSALEVARTKLLRRMSEKGTPANGRNTLYAAAGDAAKSGSLIAYHYRITAEIPEDDFFTNDEEQLLDLSNIENVVLVDDVIGTGKTISSEVTRFAEEIYPLSKSRNLFVLTVAGYVDGIRRIVEDTGAAVVSALEYSAYDTVANLDASFYEALPTSERAGTLERIKKYCRSISTSDLGFGGVGGLLVFDHNTPNTTLPIIWHNGKGWYPLFQRATRIPGAAKVLRSAEVERQSLESKVPEVIPVKRDAAEVTLFVEGKLDEIFIECMKHNRDLASLLGVKDVSAVALGGLYQSHRLIQFLKTTKKDAIFVLDDDENSRRASVRIDGLKDVKIVYLKPTFIAMLNFDKLYENRDRFGELPDQIETVDNHKWLHEVELATIKRGSVSTNADRIMIIIDEFLDGGKFKIFVDELNSAITEILK